MPKSSSCIEVSKKFGEATLLFLKKAGIFDKTLKIQRNEDQLRLPLNRLLTENEILTLKNQVHEFQVSNRIFQEKGKNAKSVAEILQDQLPRDLWSLLPRAIDIIGDIAVIEIPQELEKTKNLVGEAVLKKYKNIKTVLAKAGSVSGTYRLRALEVVAGEAKTDTIHKQYGCKFYVDLAEAYFSPRLSREHNRVASLVQEGEIIIDLFAGVGPFAVSIAKKTKARVYAVDINPKAIDLLKRNSRLNRVENKIAPILGNAKEVVENQLLNVADRVIMNLPEKAMEFVETACKALKPNGGFIHFYAFVRSPDSIEELKVRFSETVRESGRKVDHFRLERRIRETAPYESQIVLDAHIF